MKKFLLSSVFLIFISGAFAQPFVCPSDAKRNNGNNCEGGTLGGNFTVDFTAPPPANLQIKLIISSSNGATATILPFTKVTKTTGGTTSLKWCFETNNLPPLASDTYIIQFYLDGNGNGIQDLLGEPLLLCGSQGSLPVSLVKFNAATRGNGISLTWETATELNNQGFDVERRSANGQYEKIGFVASKAVGGSGFDYSYSFEDNSTQTKGVTYYRLRQVDLDGKATYSEIRGVRTGKGLIVLSVYPNPSRGTTNVAIPSGIGSVDVSVDDFTGKSVQRFVGIATSNLQLNNLKPGIYMVRVTIRSTGEVISEKIAVQ